MPRVIEDSDGEEDVGDETFQTDINAVSPHNSGLGTLTTMAETMATTPAQTAQTNGTRGTSSSGTSSLNLVASILI